MISPDPNRILENIITIATVAVLRKAAPKVCAKVSAMQPVIGGHLLRFRQTVSNLVRPLLFYLGWCARHPSGALLLLTLTSTYSYGVWTHFAAGHLAVDMVLGTAWMGCLASFGYRGARSLVRKSKARLA